MKPVAVVQQKKDEQEATTVNAIYNQISRVNCWTDITLASDLQYLYSMQLYENNNKDPLPYYQLIVDPTNFMRTIQNAFQISFLLRDGLVAIEEGEDGYPTVRPVNETDSGANAENRNYQMVSNLSTRLCDVIGSPF